MSSETFQVWSVDLLVSCYIVLHQKNIFRLEIYQMTEVWNVIHQSPAFWSQIQHSRYFPVPTNFNAHTAIYSDNNSTWMINAPFCFTNLTNLVCFWLLFVVFVWFNLVARASIEITYPWLSRKLLSRKVTNQLYDSIFYVFYYSMKTIKMKWKLI